MEEIGLWALEDSPDKQLSAVPVESISGLDKERILEDLLVKHPELLLPNLTIVGRQSRTATGWLDLLGIDGDGRLVVFELKRGALARDAVAQVIDYASDLAKLDVEGLARHIEERSGTEGVDKLDDFEEWYQQQFPSLSPGSVLPPRMMLVGLGVDEPTERMTAFLADSGADVSLVTFHGFRYDGQTLLARQVRIEGPPKDPSGTADRRKPEKEKAFLATALQLGVSERTEEMRLFLNENLVSAYEYPGKNSMTFSLVGRSASGRPTTQAVVSLYLYDKAPGKVEVYFQPRVMRLARGQLMDLQRSFPEAVAKWGSIALPVTSDEEWELLKKELKPLLSDIVAAWQATMRT